MLWCEEWHTGLPELDDQHRRIHALILRVQELPQNSSSSTWRPILLEIEAETRAHFDHEERLMNAHGFPDRERHRLDHASLIAEIQRYRERNVFGPQQLARVLFNWLWSHTQMEDRPLVHFLAQRGKRDVHQQSGIELP